MITLDYQLREQPPKDTDLRRADEDTIHYYLFAGDIIFTIEDMDLSAPWGWVPVIDFAVCLHGIAEQLRPAKLESFEFTESDDRIDFLLNAGVVEVHATYAGKSVRVNHDELRCATRDFLCRVIDELTARYPSLSENPVITRIDPRRL